MINVNDKQIAWRVSIGLEKAFDTADHTLFHGSVYTLNMFPSMVSIGTIK